MFFDFFSSKCFALAQPQSWSEDVGAGGGLTGDIGLRDEGMSGLVPFSSLRVAEGGDSSPERLGREHNCLVHGKSVAQFSGIVLLIASAAMPAAG
jgi:hypothetical protein